MAAICCSDRSPITPAGTDFERADTTNLLRASALVPPWLAVKLDFWRGCPDPSGLLDQLRVTSCYFRARRPCRRWEPGRASYPMTERSAVKVFVVVLIIVGEVLALVGDVFDALPER